MARSDHPDSAGSQFFICLDRLPGLDLKYTAFGKVIKGEDVLLKIGETPVGPNRGGEMSKPKERVTGRERHDRGGGFHQVTVDRS